jgi:hypothetical protein
MLRRTHLKDTRNTGTTSIERSAHSSAGTEVVDDEIAVQPLEVEQILHRDAKIVVLEDGRSQIHMEAENAGRRVHEHARMLLCFAGRLGNLE